MVVAEAYRNLISVGSLPLAMTDCLNYGNPEKPEIYQQLADSTRGMAEACGALNTPVVSGNVSLYNETKGDAIFPTPVVGMVGLIEDVDYLVDFKPSKGDTIYFVGEVKPDFGGSQLEKLLFNEVAHTDVAIDLEQEVARGEAIRQHIIDGKLGHVQAVGKGGVGVKLAQIAAYFNTGLEAQLDVNDAELFAETQGNYIVIAKQGKEIDIDGAQAIGTFGTESFKLSTNQGEVTLDVNRMTEAWKGAIHACMTSEV